MPVTEQIMECDSFPAECTTWKRTYLYELMPPVMDEYDETITLYCSCCNKVKKVAAPAEITYRLSTYDIPNYRRHSAEGVICPDCLAKEVPNGD